MEEEAKKSEQTLANTVTKLAVTSKEADDVLKKVCFILLYLSFDLEYQKQIFREYKEYTSTENDFFFWCFGTI